MGFSMVKIGRNAELKVIKLGDVPFRQQGEILISQSGTEQ
jgi:hypothetical protein